jgi:putative methyltransferase (TIGR04325 family)
MSVVAGLGPRSSIDRTLKSHGNTKSLQIMRDLPWQRTASPHALQKALRLAKDAYRYVAFRPSQFRGAYENFRQAEAAVPRRQRIGYNHEDLARKYQAQLNRHLDNSDYPMLYHLEHILTDQCTILDFGGNIGVHYMRYRNYLSLEKARWIVCDLPEITKVGQKTCADLSNVTFVNDIDQLRESQIDIFLACDSLQYFELQHLVLPQLIEKGMRPHHILMDQLPLYSGRRFVTLQNGGLVYYPQYVFNREEYIDAIANLGYEFVDSWCCSNASCVIPFHPNKSFHGYSGLYFSDEEMSLNMRIQDASRTGAERQDG